MCQFIHESNVMPGVGCCNCRAYNGLQRELCKNCRHILHDVEIPDSVGQCVDCGFGWPADLPMEICPSCGAKQTYPAEEPNATETNHS
jgi:hypothetical protein